MTTAIDTNVLVALWDSGDSLHGLARKALDDALGRGSLVISGVVYAELLAAPARTEAFLDGFCDDTGIAVEWDLAKGVWRTAGRAFQSHAKRRMKQTEQAPRRILADFLIAAHALVNEYKLLTLDAGTYRVAFPKLGLAEV
jgi:predicted nucleic acid-binding protein